MRSRGNRLLTGFLALILLTACTPAAQRASSETAKPGAQQQAPVADGPGKAALDKLVEQARQEPVFDVAFPSQALKSAPKMAETFKKRFGLENQKVNVDTTGGETGKFDKAIAETKAGARPTFDTMQAEVDNITNLTASGGTYQVPDWEILLAEINPLVKSGKIAPTTVSPAPVSGRGFIWGTRTKVLLYNKDLVKPPDLPPARKDLADPKWQGKLATSPFTSDWQYGILYYDKQQWLEIVDNVGKNAVAVLNFDAQRDRMLLGEFPLSPSNGHYVFDTLSKDPNAPIAVHYFTDYTAIPPLMYTVRTDSKAPATATLFALWSTTPEFEELHQTETSYTNVLFGQSELDLRERKDAENSGTKLVSWLDNEETRKTLDWYSTPEGRAYNEQLARALTQRK